jgi:hypothetical protein
VTLALEETFSTRIHAATTTQGRPLHVALSHEHRHEALKAEELIEHARFMACTADSDYDTAGAYPEDRHARVTCYSNCSAATPTIVHESGKHGQSGE